MIFAVSIVVFFVTGFYCLKRLMEAAEAGSIEQRGEAARREEERRRRQQVQTECRSLVKQACEGADNAFSAIPTHLLHAEDILTKSEKEYEERAFSPFWEAIENALRELASVNSNLRLIERNSHVYADAAKRIEGNYPAFPVDPELANQLAAASHTGEHFRAVVRKAQKDFQFATIFEQRKTTAVLIEGFSTLGEAVHGLGDSITSSLDAVQSSVRSMHVELASEMDAQRRQQERLAEDQSRQMAQIAKAAAADRASAADTFARVESARSAQAKKQLVMLDNIQRGRRPGWLEDMP
jgi:hypothetical protein